MILKEAFAIGALLRQNPRCERIFEKMEGQTKKVNSVYNRKLRVASGEGFVDRLSHPWILERKVANQSYAREAFIAWL